LKPAPFEYHRATTVHEAIDLLVELRDEDPMVLAGGQSLVPMMNFRLATPGRIIDINPIESLRGVEDRGSELVIGALVRHAEIEDSLLLHRVMPLLPRVASEIGYRQIRNRGTFGGSLCHADPAAEWPMITRLMDATFDVLGPGGERRISAEDFFVNFFSNALEPGELLTRVHLPMGMKRGWGFSEVARKAGDFAIVAAAAMVESLDGKVRAARIVTGGTRPVPERALEAEAILHGASLDDYEAFSSAAEAAADACDAIDDTHASGWYRRELVRVEVNRVLREACLMASGADDA
jgi:carbon-monoxide dehydrogenase medium subunit